MSQLEDAEAIKRYIDALVPKTTAAATLKAQFITWYNNASFRDKNMSNTWYDELRTRRNQVNIANAVTAADKKAVTQTLTTGLTQEQLEGKARPPIDPVSGRVGQQILKPTTTATPTNPTGPGIARTLKLNVTGEDVKVWQNFLGLTPPTGRFDALTVTKTKAFQTSKGLVSDGIVGAKTIAAAFPKVATPFAEPARPASASVLSPSAVKGAPKPAAAAAPKPAPAAAAPAPAPSVAAAPVAAVKAAATQAAGMLPDVTKWTTGQKVAGGLALAAVVTGGILAKTHPLHETKPKRRAARR